MELELGLLITLIGMLIVVATLFILGEVLRIPKFFVGPATAKKEEPIVTPATPSINPDIPPQHLAAIAAAIAAMDQPYRVVAIKVLSNENWERSRYTEITSL